MGVSCLCLLVTVAVHLVVDDLRTGPGRNVLCQSASLGFAFIVLTLGQVFGSTRIFDDKHLCFAMGRYI